MPHFLVPAEHPTGRDPALHSSCVTREPVGRLKHLHQPVSLPQNCELQAADKASMLQIPQMLKWTTWCPFAS